MPAPDVSDADDLALLEAHIRAAGEIARRHFGHEVRRWSKSPGQPVTEADLAIDAFLREHLMGARPGYGWLSEESADDPARLGKHSVFIVDPIDGTLAFLKGRPHFTIVASVVRDGHPRAGVVYNPINEEFFSARAGGGAFCNGARITVSARDRVEGASMLADATLFARPIWPMPWPALAVENRNSVAYRLALVAAGRFDAMMSLSAKRDWDIAAADLVCTEAGGIVSSHTGDTLVYNSPSAVQRSVVAAGKPLHARLLERINHLDLSRRLTGP